MISLHMNPVGQWGVRRGRPLGPTRRGLRSFRKGRLQDPQDLFKQLFGEGAQGGGGALTIGPCLLRAHAVACGCLEELPVPGSYIRAFLVR